MPNLFKRFSISKPEPYQFPDAEELLKADETVPDQIDEDSLEEAETLELAQSSETEDEPEEQAQPEETPISFAQVQADMILKDAERQVEEILEQARQAAENDAEAIRKAARDAGYQEGYAQGVAQAAEEGAKLREQQAAAQEAEVAKFLDRAGAELDRQLDQNIGELRDLALAIAEKVVCVSLKSSGDVIARMIQTAIDKRKRREWVHIYIAECDAKCMGQVPATLTAALSALSDRVRIIPMADDESGTCIIEMPDEIVDASAGTQLNNIRTLLMDATPSGGNSLF